MVRTVQALVRYTQPQLWKVETTTLLQLLVKQQQGYNNVFLYCRFIHTVTNETFLFSSYYVILFITGGSMNYGVG